MAADADGGGPEDASPDDGTADTGTAASGADPILELDGLSKQFGELLAVDDVDLAVEEGEFRSVIGPNGAGKTTLFNLVTGAVAPSAGTIQFRGESIGDLPAHERVRRGIGRSFQITTVFGGLTVRENVRLAAQSTHLDSLSVVDRLFRSRSGFPAVSEATDEALESVGLLDRADERAGALAYGDRRRLEIGIVLATDPALVLLDEPTAGMSTEETRETMALIREVLADRTLLLIEHDIDLVMNVSDTITVLHRGRNIATGSPAAVAADDDVQAAYLGGVRE